MASRKNRERLSLTICKISLMARSRILIDWTLVS
jgi:hypothetical protein